MKYDVAVIGSGLGGYVCAIRAAQLGKTACVMEKAETGGTCLNRGCIPTKALVASANTYLKTKHSAAFGVHAENVTFNWAEIQQRKDKIVKQLTSGVGMLLKCNKVDLIKGQAIELRKNSVKIIGQDGIEQTVEFENAVLATGSRPSAIPGIEIDGKNVITSDEILALPELPKSMLIVGGGVIGVEFACILNAFGVKVTVIEMLPKILPTEDTEISNLMKHSMIKDGIEIKTRTTLKHLNRGDGVMEATIASGEESSTFAFEKVLIATGRKPDLGGLSFSGIEIRQNRGFVSVNEKLHTSVENIYAIGDLTGLSFLAHAASAEGITAAENIAGMNVDFDCRIIPGCIYSNPEVASVGLSEDKALETGHKVKIGRFPFTANGRAMTINETQGMVKVVVDADSGALLGMHIMGPEATELVMQGSLGLRLETIPEEYKRIIYAHPTLSEAIHEAMHDANGEAIDIYRKKA